VKVGKAHQDKGARGGDRRKKKRRQGLGRGGRVVDVKMKKEEGLKGSAPEGEALGRTEGRPSRREFNGEEPLKRKKKKTSPGVKNKKAKNLGSLEKGKLSPEGVSTERRWSLRDPHRGGREGVSPSPLEKVTGERKNA